MKILNNIFVAWLIFGAVVMGLGIYKLSTDSVLRGAALIAIGGIAVGVGIAKFRQRKV